MKFKRLTLVLLLIVLMPAFFYTLYEFSSLSESEALLTTIYEQQMTTLLNSINQNSWERTTRWVNKIREELSAQKFVDAAALTAIIDTDAAISCIFIADTAAENLHFITRNEDKTDWDNNQSVLHDSLDLKKGEIERMIYRKSIGYDKPVTFQFTSGEMSAQNPLVLLYACETAEKTSRLLGICIDSPRFIESIPAFIDAIPQQEIEIGIFNGATGEVIDKTGDITLENAASMRKVWLFPNYLLAIKLQGMDLKEQARARFSSRLKWTIFINGVLILTIIIILRNIRGEMNLARMKSDFVSNVSHELRTPLALIRMYAETLGMGRVKTEEKKQEYYTVITRESERLSHLVNNILDFSKMESGRKNYNFADVDLNGVVADVMEMYAFHFDQKGFRYFLKIADQDLRIRGDRQGIIEALINLLDNAMKYSPDEKEVTIETGMDKEHCWIDVSDKGQGIPAAEQKKIFEKFYRISTGLIHDTKGSGLGLALVDYTMRAHAGTVTVTSKPGKGSRFRLIFPAKNHLKMET